MLYVEMSRARDGFVLLTDDTEQLVSRLEREGHSVSSALEAAGEAPWLEPRVEAAAAEKPQMWPVLSDWRAHVERAHEMGIPPFHLDGCGALIARMNAIAAKEIEPPEELAAVLEEHRPFAADRAEVAEWQSAMLQRAGERERLLAGARASDEPVTDLAGHAAWRRRAEAALAQGDGLLADEGRYGVHLDRVAGARAQAGEPLAELRRALGFDRDAAALLAEWRAQGRGAGKAGAEDLASRIGALEARAAPGEMPDELLSAADTIAARRREEVEHRRREEDARRRRAAEARREAEAWAREEAARQRVETDAREALAGLEALTGERDRLLAAAAPDRAAGLSVWRGRAEPAVAAAREAAGDPSVPAGLRAALTDAAAEIDRALGFDREAAFLHDDWETHAAEARARGAHPFHAPGSREIAERIAALAETAARPDEVPERLTEALNEHRTMEREWREIERRRGALARLAGDPDPGSEDWRGDASRAAAKADAILADERMCRDHGLAGTALAGEMADRAGLLRRELRIHETSEELLRDWRAHGDAAERDGIHPFHAAGYGGLVERIGSHAREAGDRMPPALARVLRDHGPLERAGREARRLAQRLDDCVNKRDELLGRAEEKLDPRHPVVELGVPHRRWRLGASRALKAGRALLDEDRYAPHLDTLGGRAHVERAVARIEKAALLDYLPAGAVRAWEALEDRLRETGRHRFFLTEHRDACRVMANARGVRDRKARAFIGNELRLRERMGKDAKELKDVVGRPRHRAGARPSLRARPGSARSTSPPRRPAPAPAPSRGPSPRPSAPSAPAAAGASSPPLRRI